MVYSLSIHLCRNVYAFLSCLACLYFSFVQLYVSQFGLLCVLLFVQLNVLQFGLFCALLYNLVCVCILFGLIATKHPNVFHLDFIIGHIFHVKFFFHLLLAFQKTHKLSG